MSFQLELPTIKETIEKQKREIYVQRKKQEELLRQLGDMLVEVVTLKEEQTSVRTKQAKALSLLKRQFDILKKNQLKEHQELVRQVETLTEELSLLKQQSFNETSVNLVRWPNINSALNIHSGTYGYTIFKVKDVMTRLTRIKSGTMDEMLVSEPFLTDKYGYKLCSWVYLNGRGNMKDKYVSVYVSVAVGEYDAILPWPIRPTYTFTLIDQRGDLLKRKDHVKTRRVTDIAEKGSNLITKLGGIPRPNDSEKALIVGYDDFITHNELLEQHYLIDDTLFIRIEATLN